jgi:hypothetical protein
LKNAYCSLATVVNQPLPAYDDPATDSLGVDARWLTLVGCGAAAAIGTAIAAQVYLSMLNHGHAFARMLAWQVSSWCFWGLAAAFVLRHRAPAPRHRLPRYRDAGLQRTAGRRHA